MASILSFNGHLFDPGFTGVVRRDGSPITFTRAERLLLLDLAQHPGVLRTREHLLDVVTQPGSGVFDRAVDGLVNRVRRKLRDDARAPTFIATRYGEGYVWIAREEERIAAVTLAPGPADRSGRGCAR